MRITSPRLELRPNLWDALVVLTVAALAAGSALVVWGGRGSGGEALTAAVAVDGETVERISLADPARTERTVRGYGGYVLTLVAEEGAVWVEESDCPTRDCVRTGRISRDGQSIVCLPARTVIVLEGAPGGAADGVDAVLG